MKKILTRVICSVVALCLLCTGLVACGSESSWKAGKLTNGGEMISQGGFIAESKHYLYYINGVGATTADNTFGVPVKGSLMAVKKDSIGTDKLVTEVVVPKIFSATDIKSGFFIDGGYVYYGTPNTEKNSSGAVANYEMTFVRTKLDGSGKTDTFFTVGAHNVQYRIVKQDGVVYIIYYDAEESALISYNTANKSATTIAKQDIKAKKNTLEHYYFLDNDVCGEAVLLFTTSVYSEEYDSKLAEKDGYDRATENYNQVFLYKAGDKKASGADVIGQKVLDGNTEAVFEQSSYSFSLFKSGYMFYQRASQGTTKMYAATIDELKGEFTTESKNAYKGTLIKNSTLVTDAAIIEDLENVYVLENDVVYHTSLIDIVKVEGDSEVVLKPVKKPVAKTGTISTLLFIKDAELYYYNLSTELAKIKLKDVEGGALLTDEVNEVRISEGKVSTSWYKPKMMKVGEKNYLFYLDNSATGNSYVQYVDLGTKVIKPEEDDASQIYYFDTASIKLLGKKTDADMAKEITSRIENISKSLDVGTLVFDDPKADVLTVAEVEKVKKLYDNSNPATKEAVESEAVEVLNNYVKAIKIANLYKKLEGIEAYNTEDYNANSAELASYKQAYNQIKKEVEAFKASDNASKVESYIKSNYKFYYQRAKEFFK